MLRGLLGEAVVRRIGDTLLALVVTETEAYLGPHDLVCHSARGRTPRTETMFGPPGTLYVFLVYGLYLMFNVVTGPEGFAMAVLIRSAGRAQGPGWLGRLTADLDGKPASQAAGLWFEDRAARPGRITTARRVGVGYAGPKWSQRRLRFILGDEA